MRVYGNEWRCAARDEKGARCGTPTNKGFALFDGSEAVEVPFCSNCAADLAERIKRTNRMRRLEARPDIPVRG